MTTSSFEWRRVLFACHAWYGDSIGGAFRLASEFAVHLGSTGYRVDYVCCGTDNSQPLREMCGSVQVHRYMPPAKRLPGFLRLRHHRKSVGKIIHELTREVQYDAASLHSPLQAQSCIEALESSATRLVYTVHSPFDDELAANYQHSTLLNRLSIHKARGIERSNCQRSTVVHTLSEYTANVLRIKAHLDRLGNIVVFPGWADLGALMPSTNRMESRTQLPQEWQVDSNIFFTLRRLENRMGLDTLVDASRILRDRGYQFRTLIAGGGSLRQSLQDQVDRANLQDVVMLLGRLPEEQLPLAYAAADCFILPTRALECFGLIVLEAFACNTPVIASNVAAIPELASKQGDGWMFEPGNATQLADRMQAFLEKRLQPTADLRAIAMEYDKPKILKEWERILLGRSVQ